MQNCTCCCANTQASTKSGLLWTESLPLNVYMWHAHPAWGEGMVGCVYFVHYESIASCLCEKVLSLPPAVHATHNDNIISAYILKRESVSPQYESKKSQEEREWSLCGSFTSQWPQAVRAWALCHTVGHSSHSVARIPFLLLFIGFYLHVILLILLPITSLTGVMVKTKAEGN